MPFEGELHHAPDQWGELGVCAQLPTSSGAAGGNVALPHPFPSAPELLALRGHHGLFIEQLVLAKERVRREAGESWRGLVAVWSMMEACVERSCRTALALSGGRGVRSCTPALCAELVRRPEAGLRDQLTVLDWVNF